MRTGKALVLDSCAVIAHFKRSAQAKERIEQAATLYLPLAAYGELYYGALKAQKRQERLAELASFLEIVTLAYPMQQTAQVYGEIRLKLALKGQPIPENDIWIAAAAIQHGEPVLTKDKHFERIEGLTLALID